MAIPTLTDIGNRIVQGVGALTGQIRNPFTEQIEELESRLQATNNEDEIVKLNDQLRTLRAASDEWSGYDVAKQDPTAAPEWMQSVYNAARVGGDNLDLVDVGTAFIPVGVATKGAALVGRGLGKAGRGLGALATKYVDSAAARAGEKAAEQAAEQAAKSISKSRSQKLLSKREGRLTSAAAKRMLGTNNLINAMLNGDDATKALTKGQKFARQQLKEHEARRAYTKAANAVANDLADNMVLRGMSSAGEGVSKFGTGFERGAEWLASHPVLGEAGEQALIEGAHGAASYDPEYGPSMGLNALEQGGLAGLMQGGISALGGRRLRAIDALPQNDRARRVLDDVRGRGFDVPGYSPRVRAGGRVVTADEVAPSLASAQDRVARLNAPLTKDERQSALRATEEALQVKPFIAHGDFVKGGSTEPLGWIGGYYPSTKYGEELMWFRRADENTPLRQVSDYVSRGRVSGRRGFATPKPPTEYEKYLKKQADKMFMSNITRSRGVGEWTPEMFNKADTDVRFLRGLSGLHYAPLPKGAISNRMADIYYTQTNPGNIRQRAAYNALLDALREGTEGGLDGLYGLGYVDE